MSIQTFGPDRRDLVPKYVTVNDGQEIHLKVVVDPVQERSHPMSKHILGGFHSMVVTYLRKGQRDTHFTSIIIGGKEGKS